MLFIEASIGDCRNVTFIKAHKGVQTQESINGRRCFLDGKSAPARPGDICRVKIVGENPRQTVYFVRVLSLIKAGDGVSSLLEKVVYSIDVLSQWQRSATSRTMKAITLATHHLRGDQLALLELFKELFAHYAFERDFSNLDSELICSTAEGIIRQQLARQPVLASEAYFQLAEAIGEDRHQQEIVHKLLVKALDICEESVPQHLERTLEAISLCEERLSGQANIGLMTRLLELRENNGRDVDGRIGLARAWLERNDGVMALAILKPLMEQSLIVRNKDGRNLTETVVGVIARAHFTEKNYKEAKDWLGKWQPLDSDEQMEMMAETLFALGEFEQSAIVFRQALEACKKCLEYDS